MATDYNKALMQLQAFSDKIEQETDAAIPTLLHGYEIPVRDLLRILLPLFQALEPPK